jgi:hypothetical protein
MNEAGGGGPSCGAISGAPLVTVNGTQLSSSYVTLISANEVDISVPASLLTSSTVTINVTVTSFFAYYSPCTSASATTSVTVTQVQKTATTVTLSPSPYPTSCTGSVTLTATVRGANGSTLTGATGQVTFFDNNGSTNLGTASVVYGIANLSVTLAAGSHSLTASYSGDANYASSTSAAVTETVSSAPSLSLTVSPNPAAPGQSVTLTVRVSPNPGAGATVQFLDNGSSIGTAQTNASGVATYTTSSLVSATHSLSASYANACGTAQSNTVSETITVPQKAATTITLTTSPYPTSCGAVSLTATLNVSGGSGVAPTGQVTFFDNNGASNLGSATLAGGAMTVSRTTSLPVGTHYLSVSYSGDANYVSSASPVVTETVASPPTLSLGVSPSPAVAGQSVNLTAVVSPDPGAGSTVAFQDNGTILGTVQTDATGTATYTTPALASGSHSWSASYANACGTAQSNTVSETVSSSATSTTTTLSASPAQPNVCQAVTLTATVTPAAAGTVTFLDVTKGKPGTTLKSVSVTVGGKSATASASIPLTPGTFALEADFTSSAPASFGSSSGTANATVSQAPTTTQLTLQPVTSSLGQSVTLTATVAASCPAGSSAPTPTGTVTFTDGSTTINTATLNNTATAAFSTSSLTAGNHPLKASYNGDPNYTASSGTANETVGLTGTTTSLNASPSPATYGQTVTLTATVTPSAATGTVTFKDGTVQLGQPALSGGKATLTTSTLAAGSHSLTATYGGDTSYSASTAPSVSLTVNQAATTAGLQASSMSLTQGQTVTLTATVTPSAATGTVTFKDGTVQLGQPTTVSGGKAAFTTSALAAGSHSLTATYGGDGNYLGSSSGTLSISVSSGLQISSPALSSSPPTKLPPGTMNTPYSQTFTGAGGTPPYSWSLPQSDTSDLQISATSGVLSGTPKTAGTFNLTVQVQDSASPRATIQGAYQVTVNYPALPTVGLAVDKPLPTPLDQPTPTLTLGQAYAVTLSGTVTLSFAPNAAGLPAAYTNADLAFASGGTSTAVSIPASSTTVTLPKIQVGTVAGTITAALGPLTPAGSSQSLPFTGPAPSATITLSPTKPLILSVKIANPTSSGFQVVINADSTTRDLSLAELVFTSASGTQLSGTTSFTGSAGVSLTTAAPAWFSSTQGVANGGGFTLTIPFGYSGDPTALGTVQATLTNTQGKSDPMSGGK